MIIVVLWKKQIKPILPDLMTSLNLVENLKDFYEIIQIKNYPLY